MYGVSRIKLQRLSWHFYAVLLIVVSIAITISAYYVKTEEYAYEMADLQAMRNAVTSASYLWKDDLPKEPVVYWYDASKYSLVQIGDSTPIPCGLGTRKYGGALNDFQKQTQTKFENYKESESYVGKILRVVVSKEDDKLSIIVDWVEE